MNKRSCKAMKRAMKKTGLLFLACLLINIFLAAAVDVLTFTYRPGHGISGNGNPGVIVLIVGGLCLLLLMFHTTVLTRAFYKKHPEKLLNKVYPLLAVCMIVIMVALEVGKIHSLRKTLNGFTRHEPSVVYRFGWVNQYTNSLFFNVYLIAIGVSLAFILGWILVKMKVGNKK